MSDAWHLDSDRYWVEPGQVAKYPLRQGDVIESEHLNTELGWKLGLIVHPTCEIPKPKVKEVQLCEIRPLSDLSDDFQRGLVVAGFQEKNGERQVAVAHTFFIAPLPGDQDPFFANFRQIRNVPKEQASLEHRAAAMTHDCRVSFLRRWLYFRFRLAISMEQAREAERARIKSDPHFKGPRPEWAE